MNEEEGQFEIRYITQNAAASIQADELALIESVMPDLVRIMMEEDDTEDN